MSVQWLFKYSRSTWKLYQCCRSLVLFIPIGFGWMHPIFLVVVLWYKGLWMVISCLWSICYILFCLLSWIIVIPNVRYLKSCWDANGGAIFHKDLHLLCDQIMPLCNGKYITIAIILSSLMFRAHGLVWFKFWTCMWLGKCGIWCTILLPRLGLYEVCIIMFSGQDSSCVNSCAIKYLKDTSCPFTGRWLGVCHIGQCGMAMEELGNPWLWSLRIWICIWHYWPSSMICCY